MKVEVIEADVMLLGWNESHNRGETASFLFTPGQMDRLKSKTVKKGKVAGQMFKMVLVEVDDNGEPVPPEPEIAAPKTKGNSKFPGGFCGLAVMWASEPSFAAWLASTWSGKLYDAPLTHFDNPSECSAFCAWAVKTICGVTSRKELDLSSLAGQIFEREIRVPYMAYRKEHGLE